MQANQRNDKIPYALAAAHASLQATLSNAIKEYERTRRFPSSSAVLEAAERFVHELRLTPAWFAELQRRASFIQNACGHGSAYDHARQGAWDGAPRAGQGVNRQMLALQSLQHRRTRRPIFLKELDKIRADLDVLLDEGSLGVVKQSEPAWTVWREEVRELQLEAGRLQVDGCWCLLAVYQAGEFRSSKKAQTAKAILQSDIGGVHLAALFAAADSLVAWMQESGEAGSADPWKNAGGDGEQESGPAPRKPGKLRWSQAATDEAIRDYKAKLGGRYANLVEAVKRGDPGAKAEAQRLFGRNQLAKTLDGPSLGSISNSRVWRAIADALELHSRPGPPEHRIGMDVALEEQATASSPSPLEEACRNETIKFIKRSLPEEAAQPLIDRFVRGEISEEQVREIICLYVDQSREDRRRKVHQHL